MYDNEHKVLFQAIRTGKPVNDGHAMCHSSMLSILGEMVCCTGQQMTWDQVMKSQLELRPAAVRLGRGAADQARPRRPLPGDPARRHETRLSIGWGMKVAGHPCGSSGPDNPLSSD